MNEQRNRDAGPLTAERREPPEPQYMPASMRPQPGQPELIVREGRETDIAHGAATAHQDPALLAFELGEPIVGMPLGRDLARKQPSAAIATTAVGTTVIEVQAGTQTGLEQGLARLGLEYVARRSDGDLVRHTR